MSDLLLAFAFALLLWWLSTGFILFLNHLPRHTYPWSLAAVSVLMLAALIGIVRGSGDTSQFAAMLAFAEALVVWAWLEMSYFMGLITGPRKSPCPPSETGWRRFTLALQTSLHHELAVILLGSLIIVLTWGAANQVAAGTFLILWLMRWSAKLNLFLGVPNVNVDWFPQPLRFLSSYMPVRPMNLLFPFSVTIGTAGVAGLFMLATGTDDAFQRTAYALFGSLLALAVIEHWFFVLPLRDSRLWDWALRLAGQGPRPRSGHRHHDSTPHQADTTSRSTTWQGLRDSL